jgi:hypothetical protein
LTEAESIVPLQSLLPPAFPVAPSSTHAVADVEVAANRPVQESPATTRRLQTLRWMGNIVLWILEMPWRLLFRITMPHPTGTAFQRWHLWPLAVLGLCAWSTGIAFLLMHSTLLLSYSSNVHAMLLAFFLLGSMLRAPALWKELSRSRNHDGDLNRLFANSSWDLLLCLPVAWCAKQIATGGAPVEIFSSSMYIPFLLLFLFLSSLLVILKAHEWYVVRPVALLAAVVMPLMLLILTLIDYRVVDVTAPPACN